MKKKEEEEEDRIADSTSKSVLGTILRSCDSGRRLNGGGRRGKKNVYQALRGTD